MTKTAIHKQGYKKTKLGWIPVEWEIKPISFLAEEIVDCEHKTPKFSEIKYGFFVRTKNVKDGKIIYGDAKYVNEKSFKEWTKRGIPEPGNILFTREAPAGELALVPNCEKICLGQRMVLIKENKKILDSKFFINAFYSSQMQLYLKKIFVGTTVMRLNIADIKKIQCLVPPLPEQQKIAAILSTWDKAIEGTQQLIEAKEEQKKGLMQRLLTGKVRVKGFEGEWEEVRLGEIATFINGKAYKKAELLSEGKYRVLRVGNLFTNDNWYYSNLELENNKYIENGDLIYAWSASFGPRFWNQEKIIYHYHIWKIITSDSLSKFYLFYFLDYDAQTLKSKMQGGTMVHITKGDMEKRYFRLPPKPEQTAIAAILSTADEEIALLKDKLSALKEQKRGLMQQLLTGKIRVKIDKNNHQCI